MISPDIETSTQRLGEVSVVGLRTYKGDVQLESSKENRVSRRWYQRGNWKAYVERENLLMRRVVLFCFLFCLFFLFYHFFSEIGNL